MLENAGSRMIGWSTACLMNLCDTRPWPPVRLGGRRRYAVILVALLAWLYATALASGTPAPSHCQASETVVFTCRLNKSAKVVSICRKNTVLSYRYGRLGQIELAYSPETETPAPVFQYHRYTRPQVTYLRLCFERESYRYLIGSDFDHGEQWAGLEVLRDGKTLLRRQCQEPIVDQLMSLEELFPDTLESECRP